MTKSSKKANYKYILLPRLTQQLFSNKRTDSTCLICRKRVHGVTECSFVTEDDKELCKGLVKACMDYYKRSKGVP